MWIQRFLVLLFSPIFFSFYLKTFQIAREMAAETLMKNKTEEDHEGKPSQKSTYQAHPTFFFHVG